LPSAPGPFVNVAKQPPTTANASPKRRMSAVSATARVGVRMIAVGYQCPCWYRERRCVALAGPARRICAPCRCMAPLRQFVVPTSKSATVGNRGSLRRASWQIRMEKSEAGGNIGVDCRRTRGAPSVLRRRGQHLFDVSAVCKLRREPAQLLSQRRLRHLPHHRVPGGCRPALVPSPAAASLRAGQRANVGGGSPGAWETAATVAAKARWRA
jgi:hypothetical protein